MNTDSPELLNRKRLPLLSRFGRLQPPHVLGKEQARCHRPLGQGMAEIALQHTVVSIRSVRSMLANASSQRREACEKFFLFPACSIEHRMHQQSYAYAKSTSHGVVGASTEFSNNVCSCLSS